MRLGSRGSALARWQAGEVRRLLRARGHDCEIEIISTTGDRRQDVALASIGGKGLFTLEIEDGLRDGRLDLAVHSLKDVPTELPPDLALVAMLPREDPRDALVAAPGATLRSLPPGARVGTSSLRRQAQGLVLRPDLNFVPVRGNVDTRLRRWREGDFDALLLAAAGLNRLGLSEVIAEKLDPRQFCPAAGQGVLVLEARRGDTASARVASTLHDVPTAIAVTAERALLARLECGCQAPVAAYARHEPGWLHLDAMVASPDGARHIHHHGVAAMPGDVCAPEVAEVVAAKASELGHSLADFLLAHGAAEILREIYA